jgi:hypothetical protein
VIGDAALRCFAAVTVSIRAVATGPPGNEKSAPQTPLAKVGRYFSTRQAFAITNSASDAIEIRES